MSKITLQEVTNLEDDQSASDVLNGNFGIIQDAIENTLSRDGTLPNAMESDLNMDNYSIINLPEPTEDSEPATKNYVDTLASFTDAVDLSAALAEAEASAAAAAASATEAETAAQGFVATSTSNITPSVASKVFTVEEGKSFIVGMYVLAVSEADETNYAIGQVTDYTVDQLTVDVSAVGPGAVAAADWTISVSGVPGVDGAAGATGAAGADYTADAELNALSSLTATEGLLVQTADNVFTTRNIAGTSGKITVTNPAGVAGDPTLTVGSDVLQTNVTKTMSVGFTHTVYDHGSKSGTASVSPLPSLGLLQKASLAASSVITVNGPTAEEGMCILQLTNTGAPTSVTFSGFDKILLGDTYQLTISKVYWIYMWSIGTIQVYQIVNVA